MGWRASQTLEPENPAHTPHRDRFRQPAIPRRGPRAGAVDEHGDVRRYTAKITVQPKREHRRHRHVYSILVLAGTSFICCLLLTPLVRRWSCRQGLVDRPDGGRRLHACPTPRLGGIAIGIAYLAALGILLLTPLRGAHSI